jgi:hypothetical protein
VCQGWADVSLLDSYDGERRPTAAATVDQALARLAAWFQDTSHRVPEPVEIVDPMQVVFGTVYPEGAFVDDEKTDDTSEREPFEDPGAPSGRAGTRAPHVWFRRDGDAVAVHDLLTCEPLLLTAPNGDGWADAGRALQRQGEHLAVSTVGPRADLDENEPGTFATRYGISSAGAVLIRPDGFVAWRSSGADAEASDRLADVLEDTGLGRARAAHT